MNESINTLIESIERKSASGAWRFSDEIGTDSADPEDVIASWHIHPESAEFLHRLVLKVKPQNILELGTGVGYSALWLGSAAQTYGRHIDTLDYNTKKLILARRFIAEAKLDDTVSIYEARTIPFIKSSNTKYDLVFMDADKHHYAEYLEMLLLKVSDDCVFVADNAENFSDQMQPFFDACKKHGLFTKLLHVGTGLFITSKKPLSFLD